MIYLNLVLIGYRGTGKTSIAKEMSNCLSWPVISTDDMICEHAGLTIPEIVEKLGWDGFRDIESLIVKEASSGDRQIIDTGGGAILRPENLKALKNNGVLVWLRANVETIQERVFGDMERPPLTVGKSALEEVEDVLRERNPIYQKAADYQIDTDNQAIDAICDKIMKWLVTNKYFISES